MPKRQVKNNSNTNKAGPSTRQLDREISRLKHDITHRHPQFEIGGVIPFLNERIEFNIPSDVAYLDQVLDYLGERINTLGLVDSEESDILVALDEAIVNAIKHGNKDDQKKSVQIVAEISAEGAMFIIRDEGCGFAQDAVPDPTTPSRLLEPNGRGLLLINHIMDEVSHNECGNEIRMCKRAKCTPPKSGR
jgi:serine/threonine-protein kinase RsbW